MFTEAISIAKSVYDIWNGKQHISMAPAAVKNVLENIPDVNKECIELQEEARELARRYIAEGIIDLGKIVDAQHIAMATISHVDVLVSWNFRHIVNLQRIHGYNSVNLRHGYPLCAPLFCTSHH